MLTITHLHSVKAISLYSALVALILLARRQWPVLVAWTLILPGGMLLNVLLKHAFQRARPLADGALLILPTFSFPSGHTSAATLLYGALVLAVFRKTSNAWWRSLVCILALWAIGVVAMSRVYLGVHYLSDVLAGALVGIAWIAFCVMALPALECQTRSRAQMPDLGR